LCPVCRVIADVRTTRVIRRQNPPAFNDYTRYKPYLRLDFRWQCCFCGVRERKWGGSSHFAVEHFRPKKQFPELETTYSNLYYACDMCNSYKSSRWPNDGEIAVDRRFFDPCTDLATKHFSVDNSGNLQHHSNCGFYTIKSIRLNREVSVKLRRKRFELIREYRNGLKSLKDLSNLYLSCSDFKSQETLVRAILVVEANLSMWKPEFQFAPFG